MTSTYDLTLVNDRNFYNAVRINDYAAILQTARLLYEAHHTEDGLTIQERLATISSSIDYWTED